MDDVFGPSTIWVALRGLDRLWDEGVSDFLDKFGPLVPGGGEVGLKSKIVVFVVLHPDEYQALWFRAGNEELLSEVY